MLTIVFDSNCAIFCLDIISSIRYCYLFKFSHHEVSFSFLNNPTQPLSISSFSGKSYGTLILKYFHCLYMFIILRYIELLFRIPIRSMFNIVSKFYVGEIFFERKRSYPFMNVKHNIQNEG